MRRMRWLWRELTRPRGGSHRFYRVGRRSRAGVAMLLVLTNIMFMMVIVTEITHGAGVRIQLAAHQRDQAIAEGLARSGFATYHLILVASKGIGSQFGAVMQQFGMSGDALWQMVPFINTGMMRMLLVSGSGLDDDDVDEFRTEGLSEEDRAKSRDVKTTAKRRNFLDFDGDYFAEVDDEDRKVFIGDITVTSFAELLQNDRAMRVYALMSGLENDQFFHDRNLDRWELIGDLADWNDLDNDRLFQGGREDRIYQALSDPYLPKNAPFDSLGEVRLVNGWHRDDVWERFGDELTIYGNGRVNINTASREGLMALLRAYVTPNAEQFQELLINEIMLYKTLTTYPNAQGFVSHLESLGATVDPRMQGAISNESSVFRVRSTGQVREAVVTIDGVIDFNRSRIGRIVYFRID